MLLPPVLSMSDPVLEAEGSIDPLSLSPIYDRLADRILPALTVRMRRIRFVSAMCVAARTCANELDDEDLATDGVTPPWLVFEWFVVEALVRRKDDLEDADGVPGGRNVANAIRSGRPVCHQTYLKTPKVFGYSGIWRRFATQAQILTEDQLLDESGYAIVRAWEKDVGLEGFQDGSDSTSGGRFRCQLADAVAAGMKKAATVKRSPHFWTDVARVFEPGAIKLLEIIRSFIKLAKAANGPANFIKVPGKPDPSRTFDELFEKFTKIHRFGRLAAFDFVDLLLEMRLVTNAEPAHCYLKHSSGPLRGAKRIWGTLSDAELDRRAAQLARELDVSCFVIEDALCNFQKSGHEPCCGDPDENGACDIGVE